MLRLLGTELQGAAAVGAIAMHDIDANMHFFRSLRTNTMTRTPQTWGEWRKEFYHEEIRKITAPVLLIAGDTLGAQHLPSLELLVPTRCMLHPQASTSTSSASTRTRWERT